MDAFDLLTTDLKSLLMSIRGDDLVYPLCLLTWFTMLFLPLKKIDRADSVTFITYLGFFTSVAVVFFITLPDMLLGENYELARNTLLIATTVVIVAWRWMIKTRAEQTMTLVQKGSLE